MNRINLEPLPSILTAATSCSVCCACTEHYGIVHDSSRYRALFISLMFAIRELFELIVNFYTIVVSHFRIQQLYCFSRGYCRRNARPFGVIPYLLENVRSIRPSSSSKLRCLTSVLTSIFDSCSNTILILEPSFNVCRMNSATPNVLCSRSKCIPDLR